MATQREEERVYVEHAQAFFGQRGLGRNNRGGRSGFNSKGRGFTTAGRYKTQNEGQNSHGNNNNQRQLTQSKNQQRQEQPQQ